MIKSAATAIEPARDNAAAPVQPLYLEALTLVERLHRRLLDVIKDEFDRRGRNDINSVQALLLYNEKIDFMICGHKHRERELVSGYTASGNSLILRIPSLCGMDDYAQKLGYGGQPGALAMVLERGYGRRCVYPIMLTEAEENHG